MVVEEVDGKNAAESGGGGGGGGAVKGKGNVIR
jgi:hypothetical protein